METEEEIIIKSYVKRVMYLEADQQPRGKKETTEMWLDDASGGADSERTRTVWWCSWRKQTCSTGHAVSEEVGIQLKLC